MTIPPRREYDNLEDWVTDVATSVGVSTDTVWSIITEIKPGLKIVATNSKTELLRRLFKHHSLYMKNKLKQKGRPADSCMIELYTEGNPVYQFYWPTHHPIISESQREIVQEIIEDEGMDVQQMGDDFIAAFLPEADVDEDLRIVSRILDEVHDVDIDDLDQAIEIRGQERFSWGDQELLAENIAEMETISAQNRTEQETDEDQINDWLSSQGEKEYDDWIFCQSCGDRIEDPDNSPRFCPDCRD